MGSYIPTTARITIISLFYYLHQCLIPQLAVSSPAGIAGDQSALLFLKAAITADPQRVLAGNWTPTFSVCHWIGVTCNRRDSRVVELNISQMELSGVIPPQVGNLSSLYVLDLSHNQFAGRLPDTMGNLRRLRVVELGSNRFSGEIPSWLFSQLPELQVLSLADNRFSGGVTGGALRNISGGLRVLDLSNNSLKGRIEGGFCGRALTSLDLAGNEFDGPIPLSNGSDCTNLVTVCLDRNNFVGSNPEDIGRFQKLDTLILDHNNLTGEVPSGLGNLKKLRIFRAAHNYIRGSLPPSIINMSSLQTFAMQNNRLNGPIPIAFGNLTYLKLLALSHNNFTGSIPQQVTNLHKLETVKLGHCGLSGTIPSELFNISTLKLVILSGNHLSGDLTQTLAYARPNLERLILGGNELFGSIPPSISNATKLKQLILWNNHLSGSIPHSLGDLSFLQLLEVTGNNLTNDDQELNFIASLTKCRHLKSLQVSENPLLGGILPKSIGNFSASFQYFHAYMCGIHGAIPNEMGNLSSLLTLSLFGNDLIGSIPATFRGLKQLQQLDLSVNRILGPFPRSLCELPNLGTIYLFENQLSGPVPDCIGNLSMLIILHLGANRLNSTIPPSFWSLTNILHLNLYTNSFSGSLSSNIGNLKATYVMDLSENRFSGIIPHTIGGLVKLINFSLAHNKFEGDIPTSIGGMLSLVTLDLSHNNLSGVIPMSLEKLVYLSLFDISYNLLMGEIPSHGPFKNFTNQSFLYNDNEGLCATNPKFHVPSCQAYSAKRNKRKFLQKLILGLGILAATLILVAVGLSTLMFFKIKNRVRKEDEEHRLKFVERISFYELLRITNRFNQSNIIGEGSSAVVYKGTYNDGITIVAIKVFKMRHEWSLESFERECKILRHLRHRNLTKVLSCCSNSDLKALVLEYMPNGSLEKWLYGSNCLLDMAQRLNVMIDVACALEYLHHDCQVPIVHCDLKPSNVLLDEKMVAHVTDFGIAKLMYHDDNVAFTTTLPSLGYIAPEYGMEGLVSTSCDVYSYGIMLIETLTGRRPSDKMFSESNCLRSWVKDALNLDGGIIEVVDANLFGSNDKENHNEKIECLTSVIELALICCAELPMERMNMKDVVACLHKIKVKFLHILHPSCN
ncbi:hypothetical protein DM860_001998 [Cuscuta australis]|uniref:non-specific serine/threonine protein kinase n=1 Tax=Cuscuta australis TaxID=267555 RepID=A0A328DVG4_9ASTE|nr:hypothetical protein DM860_001998 [Cuscuta australis]